MSISKSKILYWIDFLIAMTIKEISARYKNAKFGFIWMIVNPLSQMLVMGFIFQYFIPVKVDNYFLFLFSGLLPWNFFSQSLLKTTSSFYYERSLIKKAAFPRETIVISIILSNLFHTLVAMAILLLFFSLSLITQGHQNIGEIVTSGLRLAWLIPAFGLLVTISIGLSLFTATLNVRFRDVSFIVQLATMLWFYTTPIIYELSMLPLSLQSFFYFNPITLIIEMFHYALLGLPITNILLAPVSIIIILLIFVAGFVLFKKESKYFDDWL